MVFWLESLSHPNVKSICMQKVLVVQGISNQLFLFAKKVLLLQIVYKVFSFFFFKTKNILFMLVEFA